MKFKPPFSFTTSSILSLIFALWFASSIIASEPTSLCDAISIENAAEILSVSTDDLQISNSEIMVSPEDLEKQIYKVHPYQCTIRSKSNFLSMISYVTYVHNKDEQARLEYERMKEGFETVSKVDLIPDIGDAAFWAGDSRFQRLVAIKGDALIDVLNPKDFDMQKRIVLLVLNGL